MALLTIISVLQLLIVAAFGIFGRGWVNQQIEKLKTSQSKELQIHKVQFEKEFEIYYYLWMKIAHFREAARKYFGIIPAIPQAESEFHAPLFKEWEEVSETIRIREPFFSEDVYEQAKQLLDLSLESLANFPNPADADLDYLRKTEKEINSICEQILIVIRLRIKNLQAARILE